MTTSSTRTARAERGFTLVELLISMVAGLIVALAVVALSSQATNTFHEESRVASAEMQIRGAIDRLRSDVSRAAFMSTGNLWTDPNVFNPTPGVATGVTAPLVTYGSSTAMSIYALAGIRLWSGGSVAGANGATLSQPYNKLNPDMIDLAGNMTGVEALPIGGVKGAATHAIEKVGCGGGGWRVHLNFNSSPALWRLVGMTPTGNATTYGQQLANAFQPATPTGPAGFIVRIFDNTTHKAQYFSTCGTPAACPGGGPVSAACWNPGAGGVPDPYVDLDAVSSTCTATAANCLPNNLAGGVDPSNATINPIQIVRWQIQASLVNPPTDAGGDGAKYDLTRWYLDAAGGFAGNPEVIAEYAVDLKFAFTVDTTTDTTGDYILPPSEPEVVYAFEDLVPIGANAKIAGSISTVGSGAQPQRIRSVRVRLVTRAPLADRDDPLPVSGSQTDYVYRYCTASISSQCVQGNPVFARTRTLITEVSLQNQTSMWYQ